MYRISAQRTIGGDPAAIWRLITDVGNWPNWAPHEQAARLDGEFTVGATGWSKPRGGPASTWTITEVADQRSWASECRLPGGKLRGRSVPLFRLRFGKRIRADLDRTFAALETEIGKVTA